MKKAIAILVSLMFVFAVSAVSFAAEKKDAAATEKKEAAPAKKAAHKQVTGEVTAVDAKSITVKGKKGDVTAEISDKTKVTPKGKTIADVKTGDKATVKYTEAEGKNTATVVEIKAAPAKKEKAEKKAEKKEAAPAPAPEKKKSAGY